MTDTPGGVRAEAWEQVRMGAQGAVVTNHPLSSLAGMRMLLKGGNAVDAAVAIGFALGVAEPQGSGIASDGFIMVHMKDNGTVEVANGTGAAPLAATPERSRPHVRRGAQRREHAAADARQAQRAQCPFGDCGRD